MAVAREEILRKIVDALVREYRPEKVYLFGSLADGAADEDSDIDLLIIKRTSRKFLDRWDRVQEILTGAHHAVPVDTFVMTPDEVEERLRRGDQFVAEMLRGELLYAAE